MGYMGLKKEFLGYMDLKNEFLSIEKGSRYFLQYSFHFRIIRNHNPKFLHLSISINGSTLTGC